MALPKNKVKAAVKTSSAPIKKNKMMPTSDGYMKRK